LAQFCCNQSAVAVRLCAGLAGAQFALLSGRSAAQNAVADAGHEHN